MPDGSIGITLAGPMISGPRRVAFVDTRAASATLDAGDAALVARVRDGDERAFEIIFHAHYDALRAVAQAYLRSLADAEEIVDEVFLNVWARRAQWSVRHGIRIYLIGATRNRCLNAVKRGRLEHQIVAEAEREGAALGVAAHVAATDEVVRMRDLRLAIERTLAALPERPRTVLVLHRQQGLSFAEIGVALGISPRTVEVHLARAVRAFRVALAGFLSVMMVVR